MNDSTRKALDRIGASIDRPARRRPGGFSTAFLVVAGAMALGYHLLVRLVPTLWAEILPGGFETGRFFRGWPWLVWRTAWFCHLQFPFVLGAAVVLTGLAFACGRRPATRVVAWVLAVAAIGVDSAILLIAIKAGMDAQGVTQMLP